MKTLKDVINGMDIISHSGDMNVEITGITNDSRKVDKGNCFVAIRGFKQDGLLHLENARKHGAVAVVTETPPPQIDPEITWIQVKNDRYAFSKMSARFYDNIADRVYAVGITGTNGKTTIMSLVSAIFNRQFKTAHIGTLGMGFDGMKRGTKLTTPEPPDLFAFLKDVVNEGCTDLVMEVSSVALELYRVAHIHYSLGIFTNFSGDHLDFHKTMDAYLESKILLFKKLKVNDWAVINVDDAQAYKIIEQMQCKYLTYGFSPDADVRPLKYKCSVNGIKARLHTPKGEVEILSPLVGRFNLLNIMAAVTAGIIKKIDFADIVAAVEAFQPVKGRLDLAYKGEFYVMIDYAHTDKALETMLKALKEVAKGRVIVVFGAGGNRDQSKRPRMGRAAGENADFVVITSDNPRDEDPQAIIKDVINGFPQGFDRYLVEADRETAIARALEMAQKDDVVAIAGKGHEDYQIFKDRVIHFDDYEVVRRLMEKKENNA